MPVSALLPTLFNYEKPRLIYRDVIFSFVSERVTRSKREPAYLTVDVIIGTGSVS